MRYLPGTTIEIEVNELGVSERFFGNMFKMGGLVMSQLSNLLGLEPYIIQNWVKRGFVSPPIKKMYTKRQFSRLCIINMLKFRTFFCKNFFVDTIYILKLRVSLK